MKVVIATLLFISAAEAIRNLVGLPETRSTRLHHLLKDGPIDAEKLTNPSSSKTTAHLASLFGKRPLTLNDHGDSGSGSGEGGSESGASGSGSGESGSGSGEGGSGSGEGGSGVGHDPLKILAESVRHIGPALKKLKEARDKKSEENAEEFVDALKDKDDDEVKALLGRHVITQHMDCDGIKEQFAKYVNESVIYELLENDALDFQEDVAKMFEAAEMYPEVDVFEVFTYLVHQHGLNDHPGIKAIMMIGGMVTDAACDEKLDGLFKKIGELVEEYDPHGEFDLASRINLDIYSDNNMACKRGLVKRLEPESGIKDRVLDLLFAGHSAPDCNEVKFVRFIVDTIIQSIKLDQKFGLLHAIAKGYEHALTQKVTYLMENGHEDLAYKVVGGYLLQNLRGALTVGLAVEKRLEPKPTGFQPSGSKPTGSQPTGSKPTGSQPTGSRPTGSTPTSSRPTGSKPSGSRPRGPKPKP